MASSWRKTLHFLEKITKKMRPGVVNVNWFCLYLFEPPQINSVRIDESKFVIIAYLRKMNTSGFIMFQTCWLAPDKFLLTHSSIMYI